MKIAQYKEGFRYTSDTMFLWDFAMGFVKKGLLLEVGGGSGVLGLLTARDREVGLTIVEKEPKMAALCRQNADTNGMAADVKCMDFLEFESSEKFDYILSNPPFYPTRVQKSENESLIVSRYADALPLADFLQKAKKLLKPQGELIFCYDARELQAVICEAAKLKGAALTHLRLVHAKAEKNAKIAMFRIKNSSRAHLEVLPSLIVMNGTEYTDEAKAVFAVAACDSADI
jgi:tRNA1Val (adenine37-N6)-methyltransferase